MGVFGNILGKLHSFFIVSDVGCVRVFTNEVNVQRSICPLFLESAKNTEHIPPVGSGVQHSGHFFSPL